MTTNDGSNAMATAAVHDTEQAPSPTSLMLLTGCTALGLLGKSDGCYVNSTLALMVLAHGKLH